MDVQAHWERVYSEKAPDVVSWYSPHLETSLRLIEQTNAGRSAAVIDVGGGEATLVDDLLERGYQNVTVLDVSQTAIDVSRRRLGDASTRVCWLAADIVHAEFQPAVYDVWHDRAVFHFLTSAADRLAYVRQVTKAMKAGGHVIVSTFGVEGPKKCSGLDVVQYDAESLGNEFSEHFRLVSSFTEPHQTPFGTIQQFLYCHFRVK
jgi:2-polyprenyl-3-methyl-5-hydroxy-6-metoxy-1,4-benzoquinol methylase